MSDLITLQYPTDGVALVTMTNPQINNNGSWKGIGALADAMIEAREQGKVRVTVLASGVPGHWFEHAWLQDLADSMEGQPTSAPGGAFARVFDEVRRPEVVVIVSRAMRRTVPSPNTNSTHMYTVRNSGSAAAMARQ